MYKKLISYILILLGLCMFSSFIWLRFIRTRLPKDIPLNLSTLGFAILIYICCIYAYLVFIYIRESSNPKPFITYLVEYIYKPLKAFDSFLKSSKFIEDLYLRIMIYLSYKLKYLFKDTSIFYFIFGIFPRLVLVTALFIDVFWFHELFYIYKVLLVGVLLFLRRYIMYSFKHAKELLTLKIEPNIAGVTTTYIHSISMEFYSNFYDPTHADYDEESDDGEIPETMCISLRRFIELQTYNIVYEDRLFTYTIINTLKFWNDLHIKHNLKLTDRMPHKLFCDICDQKDLELNNVVQISVILEYYNISNNSDKKYNDLYKLIFSTYFLCWLYVLIISVNTLPMEYYIYIINIIFNVLFLFMLIGNYLYLLYLYKVSSIVNNNKKDEEEKVKTFLKRRHLSYKLAL